MWKCVENLAPTRIRSVDRPARSESLYGLHYSADCVPLTGHAIVGWPVLNLSGLAVVHVVYVRSKGELGIVLFRLSIGYHRPSLLQRLASSHLLETFTSQKLKKKTTANILLSLCIVVSNTTIFLESRTAILALNLLTSHKRFNALFTSPVNMTSLLTCVCNIAF
jgi:hypothetical protein